MFYLSVVLCGKMTFRLGDHSPSAWVFQNPRWQPHRTKCRFRHNFRSKFNKLMMLASVRVFLRARNANLKLFELFAASLMMYFQDRIDGLLCQNVYLAGTPSQSEASACHPRDNKHRPCSRDEGRERFAV